MTVQDDIRNSIVRIVKTIPNIGMVHDHYRYSSDWTQFLDQFAFTSPAGKKQVRGWWISIPTVRDGKYGEFGLPSDLYTWPLRGIMSFSDKDGSEIEFENLVYLLRNTLRVQQTLGLGGDEIVVGTVTVSIPTVDIRMFGSTMVHYVDIPISVEVQVPGLIYLP